VRKALDDIPAVKQKESYRDITRSKEHTLRNGRGVDGSKKSEKC
jgi:hypothetical protein